MAVNPDFKNMECTTCGAKAHTAPHSQHRRCPGAKGQPIQDKSAKRAASTRGAWAIPA